MPHHRELCLPSLPADHQQHLQPTPSVGGIGPQDPHAQRPEPGPASCCRVLHTQLNECQGKREGTLRRHWLETPSPFGSSSFSLSGMGAPRGEASLPLAARQSLN